MILAIDSSTQWVGIALFDGDMVLYEKYWKTSRRQSVELSPAIASAFDECKISPNSLTAVAVAVGPGSFTSLRIGLAVAKGFALAKHIPLIAIPSLDILADAIPKQDKPLICTLRAGRGRLAAQRYHVQEDRWVSVGDLLVTTAEEMESSITEPTIICGELDPEEKKIISRRWRNAIIADPPSNMRRPSVLAFIAEKKLESGEISNSASIAPIYLRTVKNVDR
jgi:tRNA threonylcarbamoyladenosine biosynthesis protein TsaB